MLIIKVHEEKENLDLPKIPTMPIAGALNPSPRISLGIVQAFKYSSSSFSSHCGISFKDSNFLSSSTT
jgi:hypothetical protein